MDKPVAWRAADMADQDALIQGAIEIADGFYADQPVDWDGLLSRLEEWCEVDLGSNMDSPLIRKIQREVRAARRQ